MNIFGVEISGAVIGAFFVGQVSALLQSTLIANIKRWVIRSLIFNKKNRRYTAELIDEGLDWSEKKDAVIGSEARIGVDQLCDDVKASIRAKDGHSLKPVFKK